MTEDLVRYGFDTIYDKLQWLDKIHALEMACKLKTSYLGKLLDKVAIDILLQEYEPLFEMFNPSFVL